LLSLRQQNRTLQYKSRKFIWKQGIAGRLQCTMKGSPELHIHWFWNERELSDGEKYKISLKSGVATLEFLNLVVSDSGSYTCEVSNNAGTDSCSTVIYVKEPPSIKKELQTIETCEVSPSTAITTWMKDGSNLRESPKHKFTSDGKDRKLNIIDVQLSDTGEYTCIAKNAGKEVQCSAKLIVEGISQSHLNWKFLGSPRASAGSKEHRSCQAMTNMKL
uniref:Ig-like domain-containing protein n=1 Tax=Periophthalmus magnuspinnatus TaxID=409849 RepID=A0A3B3ZPB3_9GOBI